MALHSVYINELRYEASNTRKMLETIPDDQWNWKPHEKSSALGNLACHIVELPQWAEHIVTKSGFDFMSDHFDRLSVGSKKELIAAHDEIINKTIVVLEKISDDDFNQNWTFAKGGTTVFELPRKAALRNMVLNHIVHHRGQLSVYLRLLNVPIPGMYGPSADER